MVLHVVVGGGASGCMAALKLLEDGYDVLLIERGPFQGWKQHQCKQSNTAIDEAIYHIHSSPISWGDAAYSTDSDYVLQHDTVAQQQLSERLVTYPQGRGLGGTMNINAMIWSAGHRAVFDDLWPHDWNSEVMNRYCRTSATSANI